MNLPKYPRQKSEESDCAIANRQLVSIKNRDGDSPLFCFHPSGGDIGIYRKLVARFKSDRAVWGIQSRLECGAKTEHPSLEDMACAYSQIVEAAQPTGSIRLLGFSLGGFVASLIASELRQSGREIAFLGLIDSNPGWTNVSEASRQELCLRLTQVFTKFQHVGIMKQKSPELVERDAAILVDICLDDQFVSSNEIMEKTTAMGYVPDDHAYTDVLMKFTNTFITHCRLLKGFVPPKIQCPLSLWWPSDRSQENQIGSEIWTQQASYKVHESTIQGSHYSIMRGAAAKTLASEIEMAIEKSEPVLVSE